MCTRTTIIGTFTGTPKGTIRKGIDPDVVIISLPVTSSVVREYIAAFFFQTKVKMYALNHNTKTLTEIKEKSELVALFDTPDAIQNNQADWFVNTKNPLSMDYQSVMNYMNSFN